MSKKSPMNRLLSLLLALAMVLSLAVPVLAEETNSGVLVEVENTFGNKLSALQSATFANTETFRNPEEVVRVSIVLEKPSTISAGFDPMGIAANSEAMAYRKTLKVAQEEMTAVIERAIGGELDVVWNLTLAANLISANVKYGQIETIAAIPGIVAVFEETTYYPDETETEEATPNMDVSKSQIGSDDAWAAGYTGAGSIVAIIDTGIDADHEAFSAEALEYSLAQLGEEYDLLDAADINAVLKELNLYTRYKCTAEDLYYSTKVPFGFNYKQNNLSFTHTSQAGEHGSHVAGISAANKYVKSGSSFVPALEETGVQGVAPDAQLLAMNVFGNSAGCSSSDYMAAIEDAVLLGADSVNLSLGSANPGLSNSYYYETILNDLVNSGVVVAMSAGNSGHWYDAAVNEVPYLYLDDVGTHTGGSPGTYYNSLCVASIKSANAATSSYYTISSFSSWGVPGSLTMKPEIAAPGGNIYSVAGYVPGQITNHYSYETMSGTSMASPQVAGMAAVLAQYIRDNGLEKETGLDARTLAQSLLMSTAEPMLDKNGSYYPILQQGAGLGNIGNAVSADSFILMGKDATAAYADGKVKAELGDDPDRTGIFTFTFTLHNITNSEKTYTLGADVFTQNGGKIGSTWYMDRATMDLPTNVFWSLPGESAKSGMDFNGNGIVNDEDGEHLLAYIVGEDVQLNDAENADINGDGKLTSYDAYLFFTMEDGALNGDTVKVPANGSVTVNVGIELTDSAKNVLDTYYVNGAYIQAYVYAESDTTSHSIPVLAFYGNWTDPSMFDKGSFIEYQYGLETRPSYLYPDQENVNTIVYQDSTGAYHLGGNPVVKDSVYMPERNAINNQTASIYGSAFTTIRNAAEAYSMIRDVNTGEFYELEVLADEGWIGAFYYVNGGSWQYTYDEIFDYGFWDISGIPENTAVELGTILVPEYYTLKGEYKLSDLGDGAFFTLPVVIDNTNPKATTYTIDSENSLLKITASDNQYIAAIVLLDTTGNVLTYCGSRMDAKAGQTLEYTLDTSEVAGSAFYLQVIDYAGNAVAYEINEQIGKVVDYVTGITLSDTAIRLDPGTTYTLTAEVSPRNASDRTVTWTSSNNSIATVNANGVVTAVADGTATITATSNLDSSFKATCEVTVGKSGSVLTGLLSDASGKTYYYDWNVDNETTWTGTNWGTSYWFSSAMEVPGTSTIYASNVDNNYTLCKMDATTGKLVAAYALGYPLTDMTYSHFFSTSNKALIYALDISNNWMYVAQDPATFKRSGFNVDQYLGNTGATALLAVTSLGMTKINVDDLGVVDAEVVMLLDNAGYLWEFYIFEDNGAIRAQIYLNSTTLGAAGAKLYTINDGTAKHSFASMQADASGTLYLSIVNADADSSASWFSEIYRLTPSGSKFLATKVGKVAAGTWPATITHVETYDSAANSTNAIAELGAPDFTLTATDFVETDAKAGGNSVPCELKTDALVEMPSLMAAPETEAVVQAGEMFTVNVVPVGADGKTLDNTNGMFTVSYDVNKLELAMFEVPNSDHFAVNVDGKGNITIAYVGPDKLAAGEAVAIVTFEPKAEAATVTVKHNDYNDAESGCTETFTYGAEELVTWVSASTTLEGDIGLNFFVKLADSLVADDSAFVRFTFNGKTLDVPVKDAGEYYENGELQYRFTYLLNAKNMSEYVTAQVMTEDGPVGRSVKMSIAAYCEGMMDYTKDPEVKALMKAMVNYGAAAQKLFNYNTENLANAFLSEADKTLADVDASGYKYTVEGSESGIQVITASLVLETQTSIRVHFKLTGSKTIDQYTFQVDGKTVTPVKGDDGNYYLEFPNVAAQHLDEVHTFKLGGITVKYSGLSYVYMVMRDPSAVSENLINIAKALVAYNKAAESYFTKN